MMRWPVKTALLPLVALILVTAACAPKRDLNKNTVVVHLSSQPDGLHPTNDNSAMRSQIFHNIHGTLIKLDIRTLEILPFYADSLPTISEDQLSYTYTIREDAKWPNGEPLLAKDVAYTTKMMLNPLSNNAQIRNFYADVIYSIETYPDDPRKLTMVAKGIHFNNLGIMSGIYLQQKSQRDPDGIMDRISFADIHDPKFKESAKAKDAQLIDYMKWYNGFDNRYHPENLNGIGPYKVVEWIPETAIRLKKKENWWGDHDTSMYHANYPDEIIYKIVKDDYATKLEFKNQKLDQTNAIATRDLISLQELNYFNKNYYSDFLDQFSYAYMGLNCRPDGINHKPYFTDKRVRRAMAHLTPVQQIIDIVVKGKARRMVSLVNPMKPDFNTDLTPIEFSVEKAKALLTEAGWTDTDGNNIVDKVIKGEKVQMSFDLHYFAGSQASKDIALMIKEAMYKAGVEANPKPLEFTIFYDKAQKHDFDAMLGGWSGSAEPDDHNQIWSTASWANKGSNFVGFGNAYTDDLIKKINRTLDAEERAIYSKELQQIVYEEQPYVFTYSVKRKVIVHNRFFNARGYPERPGIFSSNLILKPEFGGGPMQKDEL